jgi:hypothetical protein
MKSCEMPACEYENTTTGPFCINCRGSIGRWSNRPTEDVMERRRRLKLYSNRMSEVGTPRRRRK